MSENPSENILRRLEALEHECRDMRNVANRWKRFAIYLTAGLCSFLISGANPDEPKLTIIRGSISLQDDNGKVRSVIRLPQNGGMSMAIYNNDKSVFQLDAGGEVGPALSFSDDSGKLRLRLGVLDGNPSLWMFDAHQRPRFIVRMGIDSAPGVTFMDSAGKPRMVLGIPKDDTAPQLNILDAAGNVKTTVSDEMVRLVDESGVPMFSVPEYHRKLDEHRMMWIKN
jgi:hypothetical protein